MLHTFNTYQESVFILYTLTIIVGYQVTIYFIRHYYNIRDPNVKLNKILLSFAFFIVLMITGFSILTYMRFFISSESFREVFYKIGYIFVLFSPISFLYFINSKEFEPLLSQKVVKILIGLNFIPIFMDIIVDTTNSIIFRGSLLITMLTAFYIIYFQIRLVKKAIGHFKKRFLQIMIGEVLCFLGMIIGAEIPTSYFPFSSDFINLLKYLGAMILILGFIIALLAFYDFPPFYEFEWKKNLLKLFIISQSSNQTIYFFDFSDFSNQKKNQSKTMKTPGDIIFSSGLRGIEEVISNLTDSNKEKISKIKQSESLIFLEYSDSPLNITYAILVKKDLNSFRHFLKNIKIQFEDSYKEILHNINKISGDKAPLFRGFDIILTDLIK